MKAIRQAAEWVMAPLDCSTCNVITNCCLSTKGHHVWLYVKTCPQKVIFQSFLEVIQKAPPWKKARISLLRITLVKFVGLEFVTRVVAFSPEEHRFVSGKEPKVRPLTGLPDFILLLQMFQAGWCCLVMRFCTEKRQERSWHIPPQGLGRG